MSDKGPLDHVVGSLRHRYEGLWTSLEVDSDTLKSIAQTLDGIYAARMSMAEMNKYVDVDDIEDEIFEVSQAMLLYKETRKQTRRAKESNNINQALLYGEFVRQDCDAKGEMIMAIRKFLNWIEDLTLYVPPAEPVYSPWVAPS